MSRGAFFWSPADGGLLRKFRASARSSLLRARGRHNRAASGDLVRGTRVPLATERRAESVDRKEADGGNFRGLPRDSSPARGYTGADSGATEAAHEDSASRRVPCRLSSR